MNAEVAPTGSRISIVTVCRNACGTIEQALMSVQMQDFPSIEHVVVDGASSDGTVTILSRNDHRLARWVSEPDAGIYSAMNKGLRMSTGDLVGFLNADDMFCRPDALSLLAAPFDDPAIDIVFANVAMVSRHDLMRILRFYCTPRFRPWGLHFGYMPPHPTFVVRRETLLQLGGFNESYRLAGDFDLMLKLFIRNRLGYRHVNATLVTFRMGGASHDLLTLNREYLRACHANRVWTHPLLLVSRYFLKVAQFFRRPKRSEEARRQKWIRLLQAGIYVNEMH